MLARTIRYLLPAALALTALALSVMAQDGDLPDPVRSTVEALSERLGVDLTPEDVTLEWERVEFSSSALGCPQPGMMYADVITPGYRVLISYEGTTYDYRIADQRGVPFLCENGDTEAIGTAPSREMPPPVEAEAPNMADEWTLSSESSGDAARALAWSPDGALLVTVSNDSDVRGLFLYPDGDASRFPGILTTDIPVTALAFAGPNTLLVGNEAGEVVVWDVAERVILQTVSAHDAAVTSIAVGPDGRVATLDADNNLHVWAIGQQDN